MTVYTVVLTRPDNQARTTVELVYDKNDQRYVVVRWYG